MRAIEGRPVTKAEFFTLLTDDEAFCAQLGRGMLAAGRLETEIKRYLRACRPDAKTDYANLGQLIRLLKKSSLLPKMQPHLELLNLQRNYMAHSIHALLSDWIEQTILEGENLLDSEVVTYEERARQLTGNLNGLADIVGKENVVAQSKSR